MKNKKAWINLALYLGILAGLAWLYNPLDNNNPWTRPSSLIQFVYAKF